MLSEFTEGQQFTRPDGALVRVDAVRNGQVYFVAWLPGQETGAPKRMATELFREAVRGEFPETKARSA